MVPVIVNHADARRLAFQLEAPVHAAKTIQRGTDLLRRNVERDTNRNRGSRVQHVVRARDVQRKFAEILLLVGHSETNRGLCSPAPCDEPGRTTTDQEIRSGLVP